MNASLHRIRLHGPWEIVPQTAGFDTRRSSIPSTLHDAGLDGFAGRVSLHRLFGKPTNLEPNDKVYLVFEKIRGSAEVRLNGDALGPVDASGRFEVWDRLQERNEIVVELDASDDLCGIVGEVTLEIESA